MTKETGLCEPHQKPKDTCLLCALEKRKVKQPKKDEVTPIRDRRRAAPDPEIESADPTYRLEVARRRLMDRLNHQIYMVDREAFLPDVREDLQKQARITRVDRLTVIGAFFSLRPGVEGVFISPLVCVEQLPRPDDAVQLGMKEAHRKHAEQLWRGTDARLLKDVAVAFLEREIRIGEDLLSQLRRKLFLGVTDREKLLNDIEIAETSLTQQKRSLGDLHLGQIRTELTENGLLRVYGSAR